MRADRRTRCVRPSREGRTRGPDRGHARRWSPARPVVLVSLVVASALMSCGVEERDAATEREVSAETISHADTQEITVWSPGGPGPWPVVFAYHGMGGTRADLAILAERIAAGGALVFVPDYRSTMDTSAVEQDAECAYRYGRRVAEQYGGDLDQPVTLFGYSQGASVVWWGGTSEALYGPGGTYAACFEGTERPDVIVALSGCFYEYAGVDLYLDPAGKGNLEATLVLAGGTDDQACPAWQSEEFSNELRALGYDATFRAIEGGDHANVVFSSNEQDEDGRWIDDPDAAAGIAVVDLVLDAISDAQAR